MKNKIWGWIFTIVSVASIVLVAIFLVLHNKDKSKPETPSIENPEISTPINPSEPEKETYATAFSISLPDTIQILLGTKVTLKAGYMNVTPAIMLEKLTFEVIPKTGGVVNGIKFEDNSIEAISTGRYELKFKMPKSKLTFFSKTVDVLVYDEITSCPVYQVEDTMVVEESAYLATMFEIMDGKEFIISTDSKITYVDETLTAQTTGESVISFSITETNVEYTYQFSITIKDKPMYQIVLNNVQNNQLTFDISINDVSNINFSVVNRDEENVSQAISVTSSDETIVVIERVYDPLIKIRALSVGEARITISLASDPTIKVEINVIVN